MVDRYPAVAFLVEWTGMLPRLESQQSFGAGACDAERPDEICIRKARADHESGAPTWTPQIILTVVCLLVAEIALGLYLGFLST